VALSPLAFFKSVVAQTAEKADFLFVQSAKGLVFDKATNKLTLTGVSPGTVYFTDRPERIAGNMKTTAFIPFWSEGKGSFKSDPPNADISLLDDGKLTQIVAELQDPALVGDDLTYFVKILQGDMPPKAADVSVFIDIIGRPLTPFSFAGVARRSYRRSLLLALNSKIKGSTCLAQNAVEKPRCTEPVSTCLSNSANHRRRLLQPIQWPP
jgi:hypothetical protein